MRSTVARHKTAIARSALSRPVKLALEDGLLNGDTRFFDYGCGHGNDLDHLNSMGIPASGWDPVHKPDGIVQHAPVVNIGYVVNVIEDPGERQETLRKAWSLAEDVLIVSARLASETKTLGSTLAFADGCLTSLGTFQKFYEQHELKNWIEQSLDTTAFPAGPGVFYIFRNQDTRIAFQTSRYRRRIAAPQRSRSVELFDEYEALLTPLITFVTGRGRLPENDELENYSELHDVFGSTKRAFRIVQLATSKEQWDKIANDRAQELLIYLALARFDGRPKYSRLPRDIRLDVKSFFSRYNRACEEADKLLFSIGDIKLIDTACAASPLGKLLPSALYIHESALDQLSPVLRLYEGCACGLIGRIEDANIIKLNRTEPKISYLSYPEFETDPHPALALSVTVHLQTFRVKSRDYRKYSNPPILHRKEAFLASDHKFYEKFARLTRIEASKGLYDDTDRIGTRDTWNKLLMERGLSFKGHRLVRRRERQPQSISPWVP